MPQDADSNFSRNLSAGRLPVNYNSTITPNYARLLSEPQR